MASHRVVRPEDCRSGFSWYNLSSILANCRHQLATQSTSCPVRHLRVKGLLFYLSANIGRTLYNKYSRLGDIVTNSPNFSTSQLRLDSDQIFGQICPIGDQLPSSRGI